MSSKIFNVLSIAVVVLSVLVGGAGEVVLRAASSIFITVTTVSPFYGGSAPNTVGVVEDSAPGYAFGSIRSNGVGKSELYFLPEAMFPNHSSVTLGDIESMSYWTKKGTTHSVEARDWYINIYTKPYSGDVSSASWYGDRIGTEPYFSINLVDPADTWNQWSTDDTVNRLRFFESTLGYFGSYTDPDWGGFSSGNALSGQPYATREILFFSLQTGSGWVSGFDGQLDGFRIELKDGSVAKVNFEPFMVASDRDSCKKDGWMTLFRPNGSGFSNQGDCVSFVNIGR